MPTHTHLVLIQSLIWNYFRAISVLLGEAWKNLQTEEREAFSQKAKVCLNLNKNCDDTKIPTNYNLNPLRSWQMNKRSYIPTAGRGKDLWAQQTIPTLQAQVPVPHLVSMDLVTCHTRCHTHPTGWPILSPFWPAAQVTRASVWPVVSVSSLQYPPWSTTPIGRMRLTSEKFSSGSLYVAET